ncbi:unnamed protein product [Rotaria sp. Silwood2]|nr:unnamed protein product [Rotaria sp. Silwood2]
MANDQWISIFDYLRSNTGFNDRNFIIIRERYQQQCGGSFPELYDESAVKEVARQLKIKINTAECLDLLRDCIFSSSMKDSRTLAELSWTSKMEPQGAITTNGSCIYLVSSPSNVEKNVTLLTDVDCLLTIKIAFSKVSHFIRSFFLQPINASASDVIIDQQSFFLNTHCPLYLFIREQMHEYDTITSTADRNATRFRLIEPITSNDEFGPWSYDHWHGLFDLELKPHGDNVEFPERWRLAQNVKIHCCIETCNSKERNSFPSHTDRPRTATLDVFVHDVCKRENNGQSESWLKGLRQEDIFSFEHLNNLNQFEWDRIHALSVNAKRILKVAVDRERTSIAGERRRRVIDEPNDENKEQTDTTSVEDSSITDSELFANLHLIKLFIWHKLRDQPAVQSHGALAKLEMKCLNVAFEEMRFEGFVDDVLFPKIREFFLPLTISEQELHVKRSSNQTARLTRSKELRKQIKLYTTKLDKLNDDDQKCNEETLQIEQLIKDHEVEHFQVLTTWKSKKSNKKQQKQLETLHRIYQNCLKDQENFLKQRHKLKQEKERTQKTINEWQNKIEWTKECLQTIEMELNTPHKPVQKQIVKPPRGLIMYGPPGTGKSDILSKLAKKLGIIMVGPPLAAGELNRPLVGESERILIALCSRCYQVPYAMCCVSIDEIDSLAPKRDADSSEGKVDKISVLLSLIEGIKDVPNLMILSATNRLHMMDTQHIA